MNAEVEVTIAPGGSDTTDNVIQSTLHNARADNYGSEVMPWLSVAIRALEGNTRPPVSCTDPLVPPDLVADWVPEIPTESKTAGKSGCGTASRELACGSEPLIAR